MNQLTASLVFCAMMALTQARSFPPIHHGGDDFWGTDHYPYPEEPISLPSFHVPKCPEGWKTYDIRCLRYVPETKTWNDAKSHCESMGGGLTAALKDYFPEEINDILKTVGPEGPEVWVGGCNTDSPSWHWSVFEWWGGADRKPSFIKKTPKGSWECVETEEKEKKFPSICSITLM